MLPGRLGPILQVVTNVFIWACMFICLVGYFVIIADCALHVVRNDPSHAGVLRHFILAGAAICILPLCFLNQNKLYFTSMMTVVVNIYIFFLIITDMVHSVADGQVEQQCMLNFGKGTVAMVTTMMQCVIIQMCVLPMYEDLHDRSPQKFSYLIAVSFSALFLIFTGYAMAGALAYGIDVPSNVLRSLRDNGWGVAGEALMMLSIAGVYPIMLLPMVAPMKGSRIHCLVAPTTVAIEVTSVFAAFFVTQLGNINTANGALTCGLFVGVIPAVVGYFLLGKNVITMCLLTIVLIFISVLGFFFTDNFPVDVDDCFVLL